MELIDKTKLLAEIKRRILEDYNTGDKEKDAVAQGAIASLKYYIEDTLEVKEVNLNNGIQLTWEDIRELYIIFAEVDVEIELCKSDNIKSETIGYYQEVLKRFKTRKGE